MNDWMNDWWSGLWQLPSAVLLPLAGILVGLFILLVAWRRRRDRASRELQHSAEVITSRTFARGFDLLLDARWGAAADVLKASINNDPNQTLEYLTLGKLFRRLGEPDRAARMFEQLQVRPRLDDATRITAQYELAMAYRALGWSDAAAAMLQGVLGADPACAKARRELRRIHEDMGRWEMAVALEMLRLKRGESRERQTLAALLAQQGKVAWAAGHPRQGAAHLQSALALDPECTEAALYLGRILLRQGKLSQAFHIWERLAKARPEFLFLAFRDMQTGFRQLRNDAGWEDFLRAFTQRHPSDPTGYLALAECHESRGQAEEARQYLQQVLELDPVCREAHLGLLSLYRRQGIASEVLDSYERLVQQSLQRSGGRFRCRGCGHAREEPFWRCPTCYMWATPERLIPSSSAMQVTAGEIVPPLSHATSSASAPILMTREAPLQPRPGT